jgi:hypothetical protein
MEFLVATETHSWIEGDWFVGCDDVVPSVLKRGGGCLWDIRKDGFQHVD